jgi:hypothetical protein
VEFLTDAEANAVLAIFGVKLLPRGGLFSIFLDVLHMALDKVVQRPGGSVLGVVQPSPFVEQPEKGNEIGKDAVFGATDRPWAAVRMAVNKGVGLEQVGVVLLVETDLASG